MSDEMVAEPIALIVNAGGQSRRMGSTKALLPVPPDGVPLILHVVYRLAPLVTDRVAVVCKDFSVIAAVRALENVEIVPDQWADGGALGGVATGLGICSGWAMVVACDMPDVDPAIFAKLIEVANRNTALDAVIPFVAGRAQPFHGLWHRRSLPLLEAKLAAGQLGVQAALSGLRVAWMDENSLGIGEDSLAFYNVNTPIEWQEWLAMRANRNWPIA